MEDEQWLLKEKYHGEKSTGFFDDCERLRAGEPLAYVIGSVPFLNTRIFLDSLPLIPRPETEFWTAEVINTIPEHARVLDLCAGSGCIGVAIAKDLPNTKVTFAELEERHLDTIKKNLTANEIDTGRCTALQSDLFASVTGPYDVILSNPPYIDPVLDRAEPSVTAYEPHQALYGGKEGMELIRDIIQQAPGYLSPAGQLWLEHEPEQAAAIIVLGTQAGFVVQPHLDQYGVVRYSVLQLGST